MHPSTMEMLVRCHACQGKLQKKKMIGWWREIKSTESKLSVHPLQLAELERLQEAIQSFHVSYILSCMVDQQRKILQRSFDIIVPNVKS